MASARAPFVDDPTSRAHHTHDGGAEGVAAAVRSVLPALDPDDTALGVRQLSGGITNQLYLVTRRDGAPVWDGGDDASGGRCEGVIVRLFGQGTEAFVDRELENRVFARLSSLGLAPRFLGCFQNGRVEQFLPARALEPPEMGLTAPVDFVSMIATALAELHATPMPLEGGPALWTKLERFFDLADAVVFEDEDRQRRLRELDLPALRRTYEQLKARVCELAASPHMAWELVLTHNDMLSGNILWSEGWPRVRLIDYEYAGPSYRAYDMANHFCEHAGFSADFEAGFPGEDVRRRFLAAYLRGSGVEPAQADGGAAEGWEVALEHFVLLSHLFWGVWSLVQASLSSIDFDFLGYAELRKTGLRYHMRTLTRVHGVDAP
mmetsp:Transcript_17447/g.59269  ORF Transcript_17447/g.59269 Transcript_17447/m.59269 type:complete len:378 (+) Transcript_17447:75-1208(+)